MKRLLRITTVQAELHWEQVPNNLASLAQQLAPLAGQTDVVVLPEMFTTGFSMNAVQLAEPMDGPTMEWMAEQAQLLGAAITGSFIASENGRFYNRLVWMRPDGSFDQYDKRHLFSLANEHQTYTPGTQRLVTEWLGWRICPLICYDLRFPVWSRNSPPAYDLLIYVANWPERRSHHWRQLLVARAIENQAYVAGVNRCGTDGLGLQYSGNSAVIDYSGKYLYEVSEMPNITTSPLYFEMLQAYRSNLQFLADQDDFEIFIR